MFRKAVVAAIASPEVDAVVLDLSALTFVDSSGLREFIDVSRMAVAYDVDLALSQATPQVRRTFVLVGLEQLLRPEDERNAV